MPQTIGYLNPVVPVKQSTVSGQVIRGQKLPKEYRIQPEQRGPVMLITPKPKVSKATKFATDFIRQQKKMALMDEHEEALIRQMGGGGAPPSLDRVHEVHVANQPGIQQMVFTSMNTTPASTAGTGQAPMQGEGRPGGGRSNKYRPSKKGRTFYGSPYPGAAPAAAQPFYRESMPDIKPDKGGAPVASVKPDGNITIADTNWIKQEGDKMTGEGSGVKQEHVDMPDIEYIDVKRENIPTTTTAASELNRTQVVYGTKRPTIKTEPLWEPGPSRLTAEEIAEDAEGRRKRRLLDDQERFGLTAQEMAEDAEAARQRQLLDQQEQYERDQRRLTGGGGPVIDWVNSLRHKGKGKEVVDVETYGDLAGTELTEDEERFARGFANAAIDVEELYNIQPSVPRRPDTQPEPFNPLENLPSRKHVMDAPQEVVVTGSNKRARIDRTFIGDDSQATSLAQAANKSYMTVRARFQKTLGAIRKANQKKLQLQGLDTGPVRAVIIPDLPPVPAGVEVGDPTDGIPGAGRGIKRQALRQPKGQRDKKRVKFTEETLPSIGKRKRDDTGLGLIDPNPAEYKRPREGNYVMEPQIIRKKGQRKMVEQGQAVRAAAARAPRGDIVTVEIPQTRKRPRNDTGDVVSAAKRPRGDIVTVEVPARRKGQRKMIRDAEAARAARPRGDIVTVEIPARKRRAPAQAELPAQRPRGDIVEVVIPTNKRKRGKQGLPPPKRPRGDIVTVEVPPRPNRYQVAGRPRGDIVEINVPPVQGRYRKKKK